ncbi:hypothetical protein COV21_01210 [Candidatus Woesearchaeota archaeon CG10_big_fil_rev_8_21_14_0_10_45_5]|nr:MAG: hypothetical protein COV21_01210 [Candidatus Woesearchaeota archaeon CG10_big_fil_rev_8_21_14_0_10_45_5]
MKIKNSAAILFSALAFALILFSSSAIATLGVSPATLNFPNMLRAGFSQRAILISTLSDSMIVDLTPGGNIASWINFSENGIAVAPNSPKSVYAMIRPQNDIANGNYSGYITVTRRSANASGQITGMGNVVIMSIKVPVNVEITDRQIIGCTAYSFSVDSVEQNNPSKLRLTIRNEGNVRISPAVKIDIWDREQQNIVKFFDFTTQSVLPSIEQQFEFPLPVENLPLGQYWADISAGECHSSDVVTFDILEKGALSSMGRLIQITNPPWISVRQTAKIDAVFRNEGKKDVTARFKGTISYNGQIVSVLESDAVAVPVGQTLSLTTYFKPEQPGRYVIEGKVYYDKKLTFPSSSILNVTESKGAGFSIFTLLYILIAAGSLFFLFAIFRKRRRKRRF